MKVSYNWLKEYVDIKVAPQKLAALLTMSGTEVTSLDKVGDDIVFEIEVTSNRPDCLSVIGIAREIAAITGKKLRLPQATGSRQQVRKNILKLEACSLKPISINIIDKKGCPRYIGRIIANVKVASSAEWLRKRLQAVGLRPVNNIVDITNYILLETGQPLHAFDLDKLSGAKIIVRRAKADEKIITIDGQERKLTPEILVIADEKKAVAIAGVMGGIGTEVTQNTKNILLESAYFEPTLIRRASRLLGLSSDSSYRFERGIDRGNIDLASMRAVNLINALANSSLMHSQDCCASQSKITKNKISLNTINVNNLLGEDIAVSKVSSILKSLGFGISSKGSRNLLVEVPSFREDARLEVDIIEEIARIYGYDKVPCSIPAIKITDIQEEPLRDISYIIKRSLISQGFNEVIAYSLLSQDALKKTNLNSEDLIKIANPLSNEQEALRPTLIVGLLNCLVNNFRHNVDNLKIFELGSIFKGTKEIPALGLAITGLKCNDWLRRINENEKLTIFDLKGAIEAALLGLGIENREFLKNDFSFSKKGKAATLKIKDREIGFLGEVSNEIMNNWDIKNKQIFIAEIDLTKLMSFINLKKRYEPLVNFPSIKRDVSLIASIELAAEKIINVIKQEGSVFLKNVILVEQYIGKQIPDGSRGLVFSLEYQASDRTLKDEEVNSFHSNICQALKNKLSVKIR